MIKLGLESVLEGAVQQHAEEKDGIVVEPAQTTRLPASTVGYFENSWKWLNPRKQHIFRGAEASLHIKRNGWGLTIRPELLLPVINVRLADSETVTVVSTDPSTGRFLNRRGPSWTSWI